MTVASARPSRLADWLWRVLLPVALVAAALAIQFADPQFRARMRDNAFDQLQSLAPLPYREELPLRVVAIDDDSLARLGQWPWPRTVLAEVIDRLHALGARVVVLDLVLAEADRTSPEQLAARWSGQRELAARLARLPAHDKILAESMARTRVALGFPLETEDTRASLPPARARFLGFGGDAGAWLPRRGGAVTALPALAEAAAGSGAISLAPDSDGVLRAMPLLHRVRDTLYPALGLEALRLFLDIESLAIAVTPAEAAARGQVPGIQGIDLGAGAFLPTASDGRVWPRFRRLAAERYLPAHELLAGRVAEERVRDHIVFVGATAKGLGDTVFSPLGEWVPGIEGHVQLVEQLLTGAYLLRPHWENDFVAAVLVGMGLLLAFLLARFRPAWSVLACALTLAGLFAGSAWLFAARQTLLDPFFPGLALGLLFLSLVVPRYLRTEREQRWIRDAFSRYVSPNRVRYLQEHPEQLELGGVYRECSFVATDLEGFTSLMESHEPALLADLLNEYLDNMIRIAFRHEGTLDRIVGDAVMVMFSAPLAQADHAARALACALEMDAFAVDHGRRQRERGIPFGRTRIAVNTGTVLLGNFGGKAMLDYRALGDAINTVARLESINARVGTRVCASEATVARCPEFLGRPVGHLVLKGKTRAVLVHEPLTPEEAATPRVAEYRAAYALMEREAPEAPEVFRLLAERYPEDGLAAYHARRLAAGETGSRVTMTGK